MLFVEHWTRRFCTPKNRFNIRARTQSIQPNPKPSKATHPTFLVKVGYQFRSEKYFNAILNGKDVSSTIPLEISYSDLICESVRYDPSQNNEGTLQVGTLDDILAEKLRALLQQPIRNRHRRQDVFDLARIFQEERSKINIKKISNYLIKKCRCRGINPKKQDFNGTVRKMASFEYDRLKDNIPENEFIPFDQAWQAILTLVDFLEIPE